MEEFTYFNELYDYYGDLLTLKQQEYFENYYFNNLSLGEMAEIYGISRNAIHKQIRNVTDKLVHYENVLGMCEFNRKLQAIVDKMENSDFKNELEDLIK